MKKETKNNAYKAMGYGAMTQLSNNKKINKAGKVVFYAGGTAIAGNGIIALIKIPFLLIKIFFLICIVFSIKVVWNISKNLYEVYKNKDIK